MVANWQERCPEAHHNELEICGFFGDYRFLSNYHVANVEYEGVMYPSSEAAYQAAKTLNEEEREAFQTMSCSEAKKAGQKVTMREDWDLVKEDVMYDILLDKFTRHKDLESKLLQTGERRLEETNWWEDRYWGVCKREGMNRLGVVLMEVRRIIAMKDRV